jgi:two-component system, OmpR family, sensor histidine kinase QseC
MMRLALAKPSITRRLMATVLLSYALVWAVVAAIAAESLYTVGSGDFDREMRSTSDVVDSILAHPGVPLASAALGVSLKLAADGLRLGVQGPHLGFQVHDAAGVLLAQGGAQFPQLTDDGRRGLFDVDTEGHSWRVERHFFPDATRRIDVAQDKAFRARMLRASMLNPLTLMQLLIGLPLLALPIWLAVRTGIAPLLRLSRLLAVRQAGDLEPVLMDRPHQELMPLVEALNATLARLEELLRRERAFLADAAHELRTPLAVISAQYDALRSAPGDIERGEALRRLGLGVSRSVRLVNQLLALARLEADVEFVSTRFDLANLLRDCLAMHAPDAAQRNVELSYVGTDSCAMEGPEQVVETIVHNLVTNAIRHGRPGGQVEVGASCGGERVCTISVADDGPGIPAHARDRVFERFWRGEAATPSSTGSGLGLAIVQAAARLLDADVVMEGGLQGRGLQVTLTWRRASSGAAPG